MVYSKLIEVFAEAIPAGVLQTYAFVKSSNRSKETAASILLSALTTGFGSTIVSYGESKKESYYTKNFLTSPLMRFLSLQIWTLLQRRDEKRLHFTVSFLQLGVVSSSFSWW